MEVKYKKRVKIYNDLLFCNELMKRLCEDTEDVCFSKVRLKADIRRLRRELLRVHKFIEEELKWNE